MRVAGARWAVEECFQAAKNETALDHYQVRKHVAWYRHVTLAMCAHAWLAVTAPAARPPAHAPGSGPGDGGRAREGAGGLWTRSRPRPGNRLITGSDGDVICLTVNEIRRLHALLPAGPPARHTCTGPPGAAATRPAPANCHYQRRLRQ